MAHHPVAGGTATPQRATPRQATGKRHPYRSPEERALAWIRTKAKSRSRLIPICASIAFLIAAQYYSFTIGIGSGGHHSWATPGDIWLTYKIAVDVVHGHFAGVYDQYHFATFPGIIVLLAPIAALTSALNLSTDVIGTVLYHHPYTWTVLGPYTWLLSCLPLFASDALAERLGVDRPRRAVLVVGQVIALWPVAVLFGHPEDALAVGLLLYSLIFVLDGRWAGAGWLFGFAIALQPLVLAAFAIVLAVAGAKRWRGLLIRGAVPSILVLIGPFVANARQTTSALLHQPNYPLANHDTPWTALAPRAHIGVYAVTAGPGRIASLLFAVGLGVWAARRRPNPGMVVWLVATALGLRCVTESVMDAYYFWPALAVTAVAAASSFSVARLVSTMTVIGALVFTAQLQIGWAAWWGLNMALFVTVLIVSYPGSRSLDEDSGAHRKVADLRAVAPRAPEAPEAGRPNAHRRDNRAKQRRHRRP